jgi:short-subunit dehydrogenase
VPADLLSDESLLTAAVTVIKTWNYVDFVVHSGPYGGPRHLDQFLRTPIELPEKQPREDVTAPLILNRHFLPGMVSRGSGAIIDITSSAGYADPSKPVGKGGWSLATAFPRVHSTG